ncbi:translation initiation factor IF-2-like [Hyla sarda]|uniref:translation initiation factor IF-2-like n=1 Tax=Hyla sarda TaxID=327740 RepID=UPI0024C3AC59|nr:translation initiation factor IF-2-like [Hyla sarda]
MDAALEDLMRRVRDEVVARGADWLVPQLQGLQAGSAAEGSGAPRSSARRSRPPSRLSPEIIPRTRRRHASPLRDPPATPAPSDPTPEGRGAGRNPPGVQRVAETSGAVAAAGRGGRNANLEDTAVPRSDVPRARGARRSGRRRRGQDTTQGRSGNGLALGTSEVSSAELSSDGEGRGRDSPALSATGERLASVVRRVETRGVGAGGRRRLSVAGSVVEPPAPAGGSVSADGADVRGAATAGSAHRVPSGSTGAAASGDGGDSGATAAGHLGPERLGAAPCLIWILGHSYVVRGAARAAVRPDGRQLGFSREKAQVRWLGQGGLLWGGVLPFLQKYVDLDRAPDVLVLHVGGNDLGGRTARSLMRDIKLDLLRIWSSFPGIFIIWSDIVARLKWRRARSVASLNRARAKVNRVVSRFVARNGGLAVRHRELEVASSEFLGPDGVHLNPIGTDLWAWEIRDMLERAVQLWGSGRL